MANIKLRIHVVTQAEFFRAQKAIGSTETKVSEVLEPQSLEFRLKISTDQNGLLGKILSEAKRSYEVVMNKSCVVTGLYDDLFYYLSLDDKVENLFSANDICYLVIQEAIDSAVGKKRDNNVAQAQLKEPASKKPKNNSEATTDDSRGHVDETLPSDQPLETQIQARANHSDVLLSPSSSRKPKVVEPITRFDEEEREEQGQEQEQQDQQETQTSSQSEPMSQENLPAALAENSRFGRPKKGAPIAAIEARRRLAREAARAKLEDSTQSINETQESSPPKPKRRGRPPRGEAVEKPPKLFESDKPSEIAKRARRQRASPSVEEPVIENIKSSQTKKPAAEPAKRGKVSKARAAAKAGSSTEDDDGNDDENLEENGKEKQTQTTAQPRTVTVEADGGNTQRGNAANGSGNSSKSTQVASQNLELFGENRAASEQNQVAEANEALTSSSQPGNEQEFNLLNRPASRRLHPLDFVTANTPLNMNERRTSQIPLPVRPLNQTGTEPEKPFHESSADDNEGESDDDDDDDDEEVETRRQQRLRRVQAVNASRRSSLQSQPTASEGKPVAAAPSAAAPSSPPLVRVTRQSTQKRATPNASDSAKKPLVSATVGAVSPTPSKRSSSVPKPTISSNDSATAKSSGTVAAGAKPSVIKADSTAAAAKSDGVKSTEHNDSVPGLGGFATLKKIRPTVHDANYRPQRYEVLEDTQSSEEETESDSDGNDDSDDDSEEDEDEADADTSRARRRRGGALSALRNS